MSRCIVVLASLLFALPNQTAYGWGREGHKLIARIALRHMSPAAVAAARSLLNPGEEFELMAAWADEIRPQRPETGPWHYINIPITESRQWRRYCQDSGCVVTIVGQMELRLSDTALPRDQRREALLFLVHFLSDLHQPMHAGDLGDRGGNDVQTVYNNYAGNLHSLWDTGLILGYLKTGPEFETRLRRPAGRWEFWRASRGRPSDWVWESHAISRRVAYPNLPAARPALLGDDYARKAQPHVERQLRHAGLRLAAALNRILGKTHN